MMALPRKILTTSRLVVRPFRSDDAGDLFAYLSDPQTYRFEPGDPISHEQAVALAAEMAASSDFWAVEVAATGVQIGQLYLKQIEPPHLMTCELGYVFNPAYHRQGYASEAAAALVEYAFAAWGMHRIYAHCNPDNTASWKLLERLGFRREGLLRQNVFFRRDETGAPRWTDTYIYARLAEEMVASTTPDNDA